MQSTLFSHFKVKPRPTATVPSTGSSNGPSPVPPTASHADKQRNHLRAVAAETNDVLPTILAGIPSLDTTAASIHHFKDLGPLNPNACPGFNLRGPGPHARRKGTRIRVLNQDTFDAALDLQPNTTVQTVLIGSEKVNDVEMEDASEATAQAAPHSAPVKPVAILNLANHRRAGGGWLNGALAQEEALCYRSSLYYSLNHAFYPIPELSALYSPAVVIIRTAMSQGHSLLFPTTPAKDLPVTSAISLAALRDPRLYNDETYAYRADKEMMGYKIRLALRIAVLHGHTKLVLGALGCGAFGNPPYEVAQLFLDVFEEAEFRGGWWEDVVFAVMDNASGAKAGKDGEGNYGIFYRALHGVVL